MLNGLARCGFGFVLAFALSACGSKYQGPKSDHFDGQVFFNPGPEKKSSVLGYLQLRLTTSQGEWPESLPPAQAPKPPERVTDGTARVSWVGHATMLIQMNGFNILTDPVWSERASPLSFAGPKRIQAPSLRMEDLPPIDLVLVSHDHYDHLDTSSLERLDRAHKPRVIVPLGNRALVQDAMPASTVSEHDWGDQVTLQSAQRKITVHIEPLLHGSGRMPWDQMQSLWAAFVIEGPSLKIYHAGDTGYGDGDIFRRAGAKHGGFDLAILPIGAYEPASFMADSHMRPSQAVQAMLDMRATKALAHHYESFQLGFEGFEAPRKEVQDTLKKLALPNDRFVLLNASEVLTVQPGAPRSVP